MKMTERMKPVTIAPMEMRLLTVLFRNVKSVITTTDSSGRNKISQGNDSSFIQFSAQKFSELHHSAAPIKYPGVKPFSLNQAFNTVLLVES
jgi:hypothetical protein